MRILLDKVFGVDKCEVLESAKLSEVAKSAEIRESSTGKYVCLTLIQGGGLNATARGEVAGMETGSEVPVATATIELVRNKETGHESYRVR